MIFAVHIVHEILTWTIHMPRPTTQNICIAPGNSGPWVCVNNDKLVHQTSLVLHASSFPSKRLLRWVLQILRPWTILTQRPPLTPRPLCPGPDFGGSSLHFGVFDPWFVKTMKNSERNEKKLNKKLGKTINWIKLDHVFFFDHRHRFETPCLAPESTPALVEAGPLAAEEAGHPELPRGHERVEVGQAAPWIRVLRGAEMGSNKDRRGASEGEKIDGSMCPKKFDEVPESGPLEDPGRYRYNC